MKPPKKTEALQSLLAINPTVILLDEIIDSMIAEQVKIQ